MRLLWKGKMIAVLKEKLSGIQVVLHKKKKMKNHMEYFFLIKLCPQNSLTFFKNRLAHVSKSFALYSVRKCFLILFPFMVINYHYYYFSKCSKI